ncbi:hypothetical protein D3C84_899420 [compost metagenome]
MVVKAHACRSLPVTFHGGERLSGEGCQQRIDHLFHFAPGPQRLEQLTLTHRLHRFAWVAMQRLTDVA